MKLMEYTKFLLLLTIVIVFIEGDATARYNFGSARDESIRELNETIIQNNELTSEQNQKMLTYNRWLLFLTIAIMGMTIVNVYCAWPARAQPKVGQLKLYGNTDANGLISVCEFNAINNGGGFCSLTDVNIVHDKLKWQKGGTTETGRADFHSGFNNKCQICSSELPEFIGQYSKERIIIVSFGKWSKPFKIPQYLDVEIKFRAKKRPIVISKRVKVNNRSFNYYRA